MTVLRIILWGWLSGNRLRVKERVVKVFLEMLFPKTERNYLEISPK
jgi:hypothetical protein